MTHRHYTHKGELISWSLLDLFDNQYFLMERMSFTIAVVEECLNWQSRWIFFSIEKVQTWDFLEIFMASYLIWILWVVRKIHQEIQLLSITLTVTIQKQFLQSFLSFWANYIIYIHSWIIFLACKLNFKDNNSFKILFFEMRNISKLS